jgi:hypothetical protein
MRFAMVFAASLFAASGAQGAVVTFEAFTAGQPVDMITFSDGTTATVTTVSNRSTATGGTNQAGVFDTNNPTGNDSDLAGPFTSADGGAPLSSGNILIILGPDSGLGTPDDDARGGTITFTFSRVVDLLAFNYFDTEASQGDDLMVTTNTGESSGALTAGDNEYGRFEMPFLGITTVTFAFGGSGGLDDLEIQDSVALIPAPAALPLLFSALGMFWFLGRTRRRTT